MSYRKLTIDEYRTKMMRLATACGRDYIAERLADPDFAAWLNAVTAAISAPLRVEAKRRGPLPRTWRSSNGTVYGWRNGVVTDSTGVPIQMETCPPKMREIFNGLAGAIAPDAWPAYQPMK